ncbi:MAG: hypothetical protein C7B45_09235 [Sulfobacillus acidophilus]|uniref:Uncharacterized protein n=1 Tax=Sulfobacillus acidophilus TaxID=53633 RepID=A0A2T2WHZ0_9FIRM|nr:MAG: hypothetical protein C7B45_09235 [Sulfobacillus acidophilus]
MFWAWAAVLQVLVVGLMGAAVSLIVMRHDDTVSTKIRRFPSRLRRWLRRRSATKGERRQGSASSRVARGRGPQSSA